MTYVEGEVFKLSRRVAKLERQLEFLMKRLGVDYYEEPNVGVSPEILELVQRGEKLRAINFVGEFARQRILTREFWVADVFQHTNRME